MKGGIEMGIKTVFFDRFFKKRWYLWGGFRRGACDYCF